MKIFLDLDGTILDVKRRCYRLYVNLLSHGGFDTVDLGTYWTMKRNRVLEEDVAAKTTSIIFAKYYAKKRMGLIETMDYLILDNLFDGLRTVLDKWSFYHDLYLVTSRHDEINLNNQLLLFDLHKYFKCIYVSGELEIKKECLIKHEISNRKECIIVGDTETDIEAGKFLGIKTAAVTSGIRKKRLLTTYSPDILIEDINDPKLSIWMEGM